MTLAIDIQLFRDMPPVEPPSASFDGWRVLHKIEGGWPNTPPNMPEVMPPLNYSQVPMTEEIQRMSFALMQRINNQVTGPIWRKCHSDGRAMTNFVGYPDATGGTPKADYINNKDLKAPLPAYDKAQRVFGGSFVRGVAQNGKLYLTPGIHGIDADAPLPDIDTIVKNHWYVVAVNVNDDFKVMSDWAQGQGGHIVFPFIFRGVLEFDLQYFEKWQSDTLPDALKVY